MSSLWRRITGTLPPATKGTNTDQSEIVCIVDRSGSMESIRNDAIGGFNAFLKDQQELPGEANLTLVLFDDRYQLLHDATPIGSVKPLNRETYVPRGRTALYDAIGRTIVKVSERLAKKSESERPGKVIVSILTDGEENSSRKYSGDRVASMIKERQDNEGWEFFYLAANQDAFAAATELSIPKDNTVSFKATGEGVSEVYQEMSTLVAESRIDFGDEEQKKDKAEGGRMKDKGKDEGKNEG